MRGVGLVTETPSREHKWPQGSRITTPPRFSIRQCSASMPGPSMVISWGMGASSRPIRVTPGQKRKQLGWRSFNRRVRCWRKPSESELDDNCIVVWKSGMAGSVLSDIFTTLKGWRAMGSGCESCTLWHLDYDVTCTICSQQIDFWLQNRQTFYIYEWYVNKIIIHSKLIRHWWNKKNNVIGETKSCCYDNKWLLWITTSITIWNVIYVSALPTKILKKELM